MVCHIIYGFVFLTPVTTGGIRNDFKISPFSITDLAMLMSSIYKLILSYNNSNKSLRTSTY